MQKNGAGLDTGTALFWDNAKDGLVCAPPAWPRFFFFRGRGRARGPPTPPSPAEAPVRRHPVGEL